MSKLLIDIPNNILANPSLRCIMTCPWTKRTPLTLAPTATSPTGRRSSFGGTSLSGATLPFESTIRCRLGRFKLLYCAQITGKTFESLLFCRTKKILPDAPQYKKIFVKKSMFALFHTTTYEIK